MEPRSENKEADLEGVAEVSPSLRDINGRDETFFYLIKNKREIILSFLVIQILYNIVAPWSWWLGLSLQESESEEDQWIWASDDAALGFSFWAEGEVILDFKPLVTKILSVIFRAPAAMGKTVQSWAKWE